MQISVTEPVWRIGSWLEDVVTVHRLTVDWRQRHRSVYYLSPKWPKRLVQLVYDVGIAEKDLCENVNFKSGKHVARQWGQVRRSRSSLFSSFHPSKLETFAPRPFIVSCNRRTLAPCSVSFQIPFGLPPFSLREHSFFSICNLRQCGKSSVHVYAWFQADHVSGVITACCYCLWYAFTTYACVLSNLTGVRAAWWSDRLGVDHLRESSRHLLFQLDHNRKRPVIQSCRSTSASDLWSISLLRLPRMVHLWRNWHGRSRRRSN